MSKKCAGKQTNGRAVGAEGLTGMRLCSLLATTVCEFMHLLYLFHNITVQRILSVSVHSGEITGYTQSDQRIHAFSWWCFLENST